MNMQLQRDQMDDQMQQINKQKQMIDQYEEQIDILKQQGQKEVEKKGGIDGQELKDSQ